MMAEDVGVRIVTWNVNSLRMRLPRVLELLGQYRPDVVLLQETKSASDSFPIDELDAAGYGSIHHSAGQWSGVAILARHDHHLSEASFGLSGDPVPGEARWCEATVDAIRFASVYVPNGRSLDSPEYPRKLAFLDAMIARAAEVGTDNLMIGGDMNIAPADADVYDPAAFVGGTHVSPAERARLEALLDLGLVDAYRELHPGEVQFTWWDYRAGHFHKGLGLRIDLLLVGAALAEGIRSIGIARDYRKGKKPSDHAPLLLDLSS